MKEFRNLFSRET